ncbi:MAG: hypothetical protein S4CHLAM45_09740 [Chlamydiales bacterium]|nr:hypothetical protein [Chlamydiales bacterium]MCH9620208.1 hypothetical protein [Chlamydiales bacterium]MCH9623077.1 hypothetical protein [Chlamydiales bacterium]
MSQPIPINLASLEMKAGLAETKEEIAQQVTSEDRFQADAEEAYNAMAAARSSQKNERFKTLNQRIIKPEGKDDDQEVEKVEAAGEKKEEDLAQSFQKKNSELSLGKLNALKEKLHNDSTEEEIYTAVLKTFEDPTLADEAFEFLERASTGELKEKVSAVHTLLKQEKGREIIAGRNIDGVAKDYATSLGSSATSLRNLYRDVTGDPKGHEALFEELASKYPFDELKDVVAFLLKGMGYDMKSKGPSIQTPELMRLMEEVRNLQSILWVYLFFKGRSESIKTRFEREELDYPETLNFEILAKTFMKIVKERYPSAMKILKETSTLGLVYDEEKAIILSQFRDAIRGISPRAYKSDKHRQDLLLALIETLEQLEEEEEE